MSHTSGSWIKVSDDLFRVLAISQSIARQTDGAFDVTTGPIVKLWRRARRTGEMPAPERIREALSLTGYEKVRLDSRTRSAMLRADGMLLDLGGIAKGYAADEALMTMRKHGVRCALVAIGGDIALSNAPPGKRGWQIAIKTFTHTEETLFLSNAAVSTSGDLEQYVVIGGIRYSHIIDPKTGLGIMGQRSATVVAQSATLTDAMATAACVLKPERALQIIEGKKGACLILRETEKGTERFASRRWHDFTADH